MSEENENPESGKTAEEQDIEEVDQDESQEGESEDEEQGEDFDRERVLRKLKKLNSENRNLRQAKKDAEDQAKTVGDKSEQVKALEAANARYETLAENDLPLKLAKWISATDSEEILEQAEELLSLGAVGGKTPPSDQPREKNSRQRNKPYSGDELGNPDDFAKNIYSN